MKQDDLEGDLPSFRATDDHDPVFDQESVDRAAGVPRDSVRSPARPVQSGQSGTGALWALTAAMALVLLGFVYWSHGQQTQLRQQLVATQNSFARISEDAAGQLLDITGKVSATESSLSEAEQARRQQLQALGVQLADLVKRVDEQSQGLQGLAGKSAELGTELERQRSSESALNERVEAHDQRLEQLQQSVSADRQTLERVEQALTETQNSLAVLTTVQSALTSQSDSLAALRSRVDQLASQQSSNSMEQELLVLRSEFEQRLTANQDALQSIDSFRVQVNRNINTLQTQLNNLQQQVNAP